MVDEPKYGCCCFSHEGTPPWYLSWLFVSVFGSGSCWRIHTSSLYGITCLQAFFYYQTYVDDRRELKLMVCLDFFLQKHITQMIDAGTTGCLVTVSSVSSLLACIDVVRAFESIHVAFSIWVMDNYLIVNYSNPNAIQTATWFVMAVTTSINVLILGQVNDREFSLHLVDFMGFTSHMPDYLHYWSKFNFVSCVRLGLIGYGSFSLIFLFTCKRFD